MASETNPPAAKSRAVTSLAVVTLVLGLLRIVVSAAAVWFAYNYLMEGYEHAGEHPNPEDYARVEKFVVFLVLVFLLPLLVVAGIVSIVAGFLLVIAGIGMLRRHRFSRTLTFVMGALGGALAAVYAEVALSNAIEGTGTRDGLVVSILGILVHAGYCAFVFVVLTNRKYAGEFV